MKCYQCGAEVDGYDDLTGHLYTQCPRTLFSVVNGVTVIDRRRGKLNP